MSVRSVPPPCAVIQSATPADRTLRRSSSVVRARACVHACVRACRRGAMRCKEKRPAKKKVGTLNKKKALRARREAERAALPKRFPVARGDSAKKLVTGPLDHSRPQVLCRGVGNDIFRPLSLSRGCPLHWADGPAFTGGDYISSASYARRG